MTQIVLTSLANKPACEDFLSAQTKPLSWLSISLDLGAVDLDETRNELPEFAKAPSACWRKRSTFHKTRERRDQIRIIL
ncbi:hypothetical protein U5A82_00595 [Sphingobium sp. CR2-8]|uniref:hypothetical protein n=1 Tax=Sphingobium sp. CR2-8 TaxID=1306534 RepID=UPI002DB7CB14|nr:hypothetical protein [Sphingobium sp. CR2-8]MEC3909019.1 hypothetical protein [Sphingobium sp. CR2-8]